MINYSFDQFFMFVNIHEDTKSTNIEYIKKFNFILLKNIVMELKAENGSISATVPITNYLL